MSLERLRVPTEKLRWQCDPSVFPFETTEELPSQLEIIGQERAVKAIQLGLAVPSRGYNVYVQGLTGTGRETTVKYIAERLAVEGATLTDKIYVNNFQDPDRPHVLYLPAGRGSSFRKDMDGLIDEVRRAVPAVLESDEFKKRRKRVLREKEQEGQALMQELQERIKKEGLVMNVVRVGPILQLGLAALVQGKLRSLEELEKLLAEGEITREEFDRIQGAQKSLANELRRLSRQADELERQAREAIETLVLDLGSEIVTPRIEDLKTAYEGDRVHAYLDDVKNHMLENLDIFATPHEKSREPTGIVALISEAADPFHVYRVNLLVDNQHTTKTPVIVETHPTYKNLFGTIARRWDPTGGMRADFTKIKAGSFVRADGGFLILSLLDLVVEPGSYQALKRALKTNKVDIQGYDPLYFLSSTAIRPEPIDVRVKVLLIGQASLYPLLCALDTDFRKLVKVKADFDTVMNRTAESVKQYAEFIRRTTDVEKLLPFDRGAVAAVVEQGVRLSGRQKKVSTRFSEVADLVRESTYWAREAGKSLVEREHVEKALRERIARVDLTETKIRELIEGGFLQIELEGSQVGQANGLVLHDVGDYRFGRPMKITASVAPGRKGVVHIDRESELSGKVHDKGVLILSGYLRSRFAQRQPLSITAGLAFEQSYVEVEGDSASSAELYALVSELARVAIRQELAVIGSVNQKGEIQAIGDINEKIEGFYDICRAKGLTGTQGVVVPAVNVDDLMLREDIVEAVKQGRFHLYAIQTIEQGIEILAGLPAGELDASGDYPEDTVFGLVQARLREMTELVRDLPEDNVTDAEAEAREP